MREVQGFPPRSHPGSGLDKYNEISLQHIPASHTGHQITQFTPFVLCYESRLQHGPSHAGRPSELESAQQHIDHIVRDIMAPSEASRRQGPLLCAVEVHEVQGSLTTSRVGEVCPRFAQKS